MNAIQPDDYFAAVESRFDSPSPYGRREITVEAPKHVCECGKAFDTEQGLRVHKGRAHSKPDTAPEQKVNPGEEPIPDYEPPTCEACDAPAERRDSGEFLCDECYEDGHVTLRDLARDGITLRLTPDYRMELIETLAELAMWQVHLDDGGAAAEATLARIKAVAR
jgi:hypothetical protein